MLKKKYNNRPSLSQSPATQLSYHHSIDQTPNKINTVISKIFLQEKYFPNLKICSFWLSKQYHADKYEVSDTLNGGGGAAIYTFQPEGLQGQGFVSLAPGIWCCDAE